jgi:hypothetical protein
MSVSADARSRLSDFEERLDPGAARASAIASLDAMFGEGTPPDPPPEGFQQGRFITATIAEGLDGIGRRLSHLYMPWLGKSFDPAGQEGVNVLAKSALTPMKAMWPKYEPERILADRVEAFRFKTRVEAGAIDPGVQVLKIDYDFEPNPTLVIRRILDELVQVEDGLYLGRILYRSGGGFKRIGFFTLEH